MVRWMSSQHDLHADDDLSTLSCDVNVYPPSTANAPGQNTPLGSDDRFENEFVAFSSGSPGPSKGSPLPSELLLPTDKVIFMHHRGAAPQARASVCDSFCLPSFLRQYPPFLRAVFLFCIVSILSALALIVGALVVKARQQNQGAALSYGNDDFWDSNLHHLVPTQDVNSQDIFVAEDESSAYSHLDAQDDPLLTHLDNVKVANQPDPSSPPSATSSATQSSNTNNVASTTLPTTAMGPFLGGTMANGGTFKREKVAKNMKRIMAVKDFRGDDKNDDRRQRRRYER